MRAFRAFDPDGPSGMISLRFSAYPSGSSGSDRIFPYDAFRARVRARDSGEPKKPGRIRTTRTDFQKNPARSVAYARPDSALIRPE